MTTATPPEKKDPVTTPERVKKSVGPGGACFKTITATLFFTMAMLDLSIAYFVTSTETLNTSFLFQYYLWKREAPIVKPVMTAIGLLVPLSMLQSTVAFFNTFTHKATRTRHVLDVIRFFVLYALVYLNVVYIRPYQALVLEAALENKTASVTMEYVQEQLLPMLLGFCCNVGLLVLPIIAYVDQVKNENALRDAAGAAKVVEDVKPAVVEKNAVAAEEKAKKD